VTVTMVDDDPLSVTELGTEHVNPAGTPLQVNDTVCLNPPAGAIASVYFAVPPGELWPSSNQTKPSRNPVPSRTTI